MLTVQAASQSASPGPIGAAAEKAQRVLVDSFIARGTMIPFSTPALHLARLRVDVAGHLEALLPAFSGADGIYIVPFRTLPNVATLTVHDRALFAAIVDRGVRSPDALHAAACDVARKGLAGARAAEAAAKAQAREQDERALAKAWLIAATINRAARDKDSPALSPAALLRAGGPEKARGMLDPIARSIGATTDVVLQRLDEWGGLIAAVGVGGMERQPRLRRVAAAVGELSNQIRRWSGDDDTRDGDIARELAVLAAELAKTCGGFFQRLDELAGQPATALAAWDRWRDQIALLANSASWVLDGWEYYVLSWRDAADHARSVQTEAIHEIRSVFPRNLAHVFQPVVDMAPEMPGRKGVRLNQSWRHGGSDAEMRRRLERLKERTL